MTKLKLFLFVFILSLNLVSSAVSIGDSNLNLQAIEVVNIPDPIFDNNTAFVNESGNWVTNIGTLSGVNETQFSNEGGFLTAIISFWDSIFINKAGDSFDAEETQFNYTFVDPGHGPGQGLAQQIFKSTESDAGMTVRVENDAGHAMLLFAGGSNRIGVGETNNFLGLGVSGQNMNFILQDVATSFIWRQFDGVNLTTTMELQDDGNLLLQNDLILNNSGIFLDDDGDQFITTNIGGFPFNGIGTNATWFGHDVIKEQGEVVYLFTVQNNTELLLVSGRNNSFGSIGNSFGIIPEYMARENFTELDGTINLSKVTDYPFLCDFFSVACSFNADTEGNAIDELPGGPLLWTMGDFEVWQSAKIHKGISVDGIATFNLNGNHMDVNNGSIHISTPVTFIEGFNQSDPVTKFIEVFSGSLGRFVNIQVDIGNWNEVVDVINCQVGDCAMGDGAGSGNVIMQTNISTSDINETQLSFVYSSVNLIGSADFTVTVNNNVGSGDVSVFSDSTSTVTLSSQVISLPSSMDDEPLVTINFECNVNSAGKPNRQCFVDTVKLNGSAISTTTIEVSGFDSQICFSDGIEDLEGVCPIGIFYNASSNQVFPNGNWNLSGASGFPTSHSALTNLEFSVSGHTFSASEQTLDIGSYNLTTTGNITADRYNTVLGTDLITLTDDELADLLHRHVMVNRVNFFNQPAGTTPEILVSATPTKAIWTLAPNLTLGNINVSNITATGFFIGDASLLTNTRWDANATNVFYLDANNNVTGNNNFSGSVNFTNGVLMRNLNISNGSFTIERSTPTDGQWVFDIEDAGFFKGFRFNNGAAGATMNVFRGRGTADAPLNMNNNFVLFAFNTNAFVNATVGQKLAAHLRFRADGQHNATSYPTKIIFATTDVLETVREVWGIFKEGSFRPFNHEDIGSPDEYVGTVFTSILNTTTIFGDDDELEFMNGTGFMAIGISNFVLHTFDETSDNPLETFVHNNYLYQINSTINDTSRPEFRPEPYIYCDEDQHGVEYCEDRIRQVKYYPHLINITGTSGGQRGEDMEGALIDLNENIDLEDGKIFFNREVYIRGLDNSTALRDIIIQERARVDSLETTITRLESEQDEIFSCFRLSNLEMRTCIADLSDDVGLG